MNEIMINEKRKKLIPRMFGAGNGYIDFFVMAPYSPRSFVSNNAMSTGAMVADGGLVRLSRGWMLAMAISMTKDFPYIMLY